MIAPKRARAVFALIVIAYCLYAVAFIVRTSADIEPNSYIREGKRYFVLFDDAMISMRYARNLADGYGLVWNPGGERVEGFTNPAWVGYMAIFHGLGIDESKTSLAIQLSGLLFLAANLFVVRRIADRLTGRPVVGLGAALFTAFYLPLNTWSLQGTEVSVLTLIVSLAACWTLRDLDGGRFPVAPYLLLGFSTLIRMDMAVPFLAVLSFLFFADRAHRWRHVLAGLLILAAFVAPQTIFRRWYYGDWLPNTYYLKMEGYPLVKRLTHGLEVSGRFFARFGILPFGVFVFRRDRGARLLAWLFVAQVVYNIYVGGDAWEHYGGANRYLSIAMPLLFVLLWTALDALAAHLIAGGRQLAGQAPGRAAEPRAVRIGLGAFVVFLFITFNYTYGTGALKEWLLIEPSLYAAGNGDKVRGALLLEAITTPDARTALAGAGIVPYFAENRQFVDLLGKNDRVIGRMAMDQTIIPEFKPGHMKWDYAYSIGELRPDVVLELWVHEQDAGPYLNDGYQPVWFPPKNGTIWLLRDSPNILWERLGG